jgi:hypothetical protein
MKPRNEISPAFSLPLATLGERDWAYRVSENAEPDGTIRELDRVGSLLGTRSRGPAGALEEIVHPKRSKLRVRDP